MFVWQVCEHYKQLRRLIEQTKVLKKRCTSQKLH